MTELYVKKNYGIFDVPVPVKFIGRKKNIRSYEPNVGQDIETAFLAQDNDKSFYYIEGCSTGLHFSGDVLYRRSIPVAKRFLIKETPVVVINNMSRFLSSISSSFYVGGSFSYKGFNVLNLNTESIKFITGGIGSVKDIKLQSVPRTFTWISRSVHNIIDKVMSIKLFRSNKKWIAYVPYRCPYLLFRSSLFYLLMVYSKRPSLKKIREDVNVGTNDIIYYDVRFSPVPKKKFCCVDVEKHKIISDKGRKVVVTDYVMDKDGSEYARGTVRLRNPIDRVVSMMNINGWHRIDRVKAEKYEVFF